MRCLHTVWLPLPGRPVNPARLSSAFNSRILRGTIASTARYRYSTMAPAASPSPEGKGRGDKSCPSANQAARQAYGPSGCPRGRQTRPLSARFIEIGVWAMAQKRGARSLHHASTNGRSTISRSIDEPRDA